LGNWLFCGFSAGGLPEVLNVDDYARIRLAHRDGVSIREIARSCGHSRVKIRQVLQEAEPKPYTLRTPRPKRTLAGEFQDVIQEILQYDLAAFKKQRHTIKRILDRLQQEYQFTGGYDAVRMYVNSLRVPKIETFLPIAVDAGQRVERDFGQIEIDFPDGCRTVSVLLITWAYFSAIFFRSRYQAKRRKRFYLGVDSGLISVTLAKLPRGNRPSADNACLRKPRRSLELRVPNA